MLVFPADVGHHHGREYMDTDYGVIAMLLQEGVQLDRRRPAEKIDRLGRVLFLKPVGDAVELRRFFIDENMPLCNDVRFQFRHEIQRVDQVAFHAAGQ